MLNGMRLARHNDVVTKTEIKRGNKPFDLLPLLYIESALLTHLKAVSAIFHIG
jgi:hypothetical protein